MPLNNKQIESLKNLADSDILSRHFLVKEWYIRKEKEGSKANNQDNEDVVPIEEIIKYLSGNYNFKNNYKLRGLSYDQIKKIMLQ